MTQLKPNPALDGFRRAIFLFALFVFSCDDDHATEPNDSQDFDLVSTLAGGQDPGFADGTGSAAKFRYPGGMVVDREGNVYVADYANHSIRKITPSGIVSTFAGTGEPGAENGERLMATFQNPYGLAMDAAGNLYIGDVANHRVRKIDPQGMVTTLAGKRKGFSDRKGEMAMFDHPYGVAVDAAQNVYVADSYNNRIRVISPDGSTRTIAGNGNDGFVDGHGSSAEFFVPVGIVVGDDGAIYVCDEGNSSVRKITTDGRVTTLAGSGKFSFSDGVGREAIFNAPGGIAVDDEGNLFVADYFNNCIRKVSAQGEVRKIAGSLEKGFSDGPADEAEFYYPFGIAVDGAGVIYVADHYNHRVRKIN